MAISNSLAKKVEADVKGSQEATVEKQIKYALSEIKNKFKYTESYLSTLYDSGFRAYLKSKTFNRLESKEIIAINNIKQRIIRQGLEERKEKVENPNLATKAIYRTLGISRDINSNSKAKNIIKGVIDECMAIPDMLIHIVQHPIDFAKGLGTLITHPGQLWSALKQAYGDAFTQGIATPSAQYRTGRSATLIALTFIPGGLGKSLVNVAKSGGRFATRQASRVTARITGKETAKNTAKQTAKQTAERQATVAGFAGKGAEKAKQAANATKKAEQTTKRVERTAKTIEEAKTSIQTIENNIKNTNKYLDAIKKGVESKTKELRKLQRIKKPRPTDVEARITELKNSINLGKAKQTEITKKLNELNSNLTKAKNNLSTLEGRLQSTRERGLQQVREAETADRIAQAAQKMKTPVKPKGKIGQGVDLIRSGLSELPVIKQIAKIKNGTLNKLGHPETLWFRSAHPDLYASLIAKQNNLLRARSILAKNATALEENLAKLVKAEKAIKTAKTRIARLEAKGIKGKRLDNAKLALAKAESNVTKFSKAHEVLGSRVSKFTKEIENFEKALADITKKARNIKLRDHVVDAQIWASLLYTAESSKLDKEIQAAIDGIDDSADLEEEIEELEKELSLIEKELNVDGLGTGQTEFNDSSIIIDLPEGVNLSEVDTSKYKIIITGMASKTGSESVNRRIAQQRAENAKKILIEKYGIKDEGQIDLQIDLQSEHPDKLGEDLSKWQGARIKLEPVTNPKKPTAKDGILDENNLDESLFKNWTE